MHVLTATLSASEVFEQLLIRRAATVPESDIPTLRNAFQVAQDLYADREHWTGETILQHCLGTLQCFLQFEPDDRGIIASLLHHALETKLWTLDEIERHYGPDVRSIVSGVHLLSHVSMKGSRMSLENMRLMFMRVSDDIRVVLLILCDTNHMLERLPAMTAEQRRVISRDVLHLFAPVAARLGIYSLKHQLEDRAFPVAYPTDAARIAEQLHELHARHGDFLPDAAANLHAYLEQENVQALIEGREKQPYSVFQKMRMKSVTHVGDIYDLFALRVVVDADASCYQSLGLLHRIGHPVAHRFKDYIAFPKPNGYQSLHTTLMRLPGVPDGVFLEVQIRTEAMHREAELGIAAHWSYKEGTTAERAARAAQLQRALMFQQPMDTPVQKSFGDHIFVLTPKGDIVELPEGATPLDFAFHVHTALGLSYRSARVNGSIVPLHHELENGDVVEIIRGRDAQPSQQWFHLLKTASARSRLKRHLLQQERPLFLQLGRDALNQELVRKHLPHLDTDLKLLRMVDGQKLSIAEREDLLVKIGQGAQNAASLLPHLAALHGEEGIDPMLQKRHKAGMGTLKGAYVPHVEGDIPMPTRMARCCKPDAVKREALMGVVGRDGTVRVHRSRCKMLQSTNPERKIAVRWVQEERKSPRKVKRKDPLRPGNRRKARENGVT